MVLPIRPAASCLALSALLASAGSAAGGVTVTLTPGSALTIPQGGGVNVGVVIQFTGLTPAPTDRFGAAIAALDAQLGASTPAGISLGAFASSFSVAAGAVSQPVPVGARPALDHNGDGVVESGDFLAFAADWNAESPSHIPVHADYNGDTSVDTDDIADYLSDFHALRSPVAAVLPGLLDVAVASFNTHPFSAGGMTMSNAVLIGSITVNASAAVTTGTMFTLSVTPLSSASVSPLGRAGTPSGGTGKRSGELIGDSITFTVVVPAPPVAGSFLLAGLLAARRRR